MSIVTPVAQQTFIRLYGAVGWDNTYVNIRLFDSEAQRVAYFTPLQIDDGQFNACSVVKSNRIRVEGRINDFLNCTYMIFQNTGISNAFPANERMYYCFVTSVDYVNVNSVEIEFEIDWIQTYLFEFEFEACLVQKEHVSSDGIGEHLLDEQIETGEYMVTNRHEILYGKSVIMTVVPDTPAVTYENGIVNAALVYCYKVPSELSSFEGMIEDYTQDPEKIVNITMGVNEMSGRGEKYQLAVDFNQIVDVAPTRSFTNAKGQNYTPHNNKLFSYPYRLCTVDNYGEQVVQLRWEEFANGTPQFVVEGTPTPKPCMQIFPLRYKGTKDSYGSDCREFTVQYDNFPSVAWVNDTYKAWVSQFGHTNSVNVDAQVTGKWISVAGDVINLHAASAIDDVRQALTTDWNWKQDVSNHALHNVQMFGSIGGAGMLYDTGKIGFRITEYGITSDMARKIDGIFDRYGYRVDTVKVPNIKGRQYVNYVKTADAQVKGSIPDIARRTMENALNRGVSFWHVNEIGAPLSDNPIVGG